ncbi:MAG: protoheme IX farnesyltransferase [Planctomycetes bacterium]|nr:protoheme IX farnesyltransferase [Planctomycetota bacterium]
MSALAAIMDSMLTTSRAWLSDLAALTKPRLNLLVLFAAGAGYCLGLRGPLDVPHLFYTMLGIFLVASGASVLNQIRERDADARMERTASRPMPSGRWTVVAAAILAVLLSAAGTLLLALTTTRMAAGLAALTLVLYVFLYTPLKRSTSLNTVIGAFPGALPPLIGWAAAGKLDGAAGTLFAIVFLWQMPHFFAIAWLYREDYARGGFKMLPVVEPDGRGTGMRAVLYSVGLLAIAWMPTAFKLTGMLYAGSALALSAGLLVMAILFARDRTNATARRLFLASVIYLPLLLGVMIFDKGGL